MPTFTRVLITLCVGAAAILAWQSYGDTATRIIAGSYAELGRLTPRTTPIAYRAHDREWFISIDLDAIRQIVGGIAVTQEEIARNFDQLRGSEEEVMREIVKLQEAEQQSRGTKSAALLLTPPSLARKPIPQSPETLRAR